MPKIKNANLLKLADPDTFNQCLRRTNERYRRFDAATYLYRELLEKHAAQRLEDLLGDGRFFELVYATLCAFNMNQRAAKLLPLEDFKRNVKSLKGDLVALSGKRLDSLSDEEFESELKIVQRLFGKIEVMQGASQIVGISKTLHFLLPNLVILVDRKYTLNFFYGANIYYKDREPEWRLFEQILRFCHMIAKQIKRYDVANERDPIPKIIDKAIIGFRDPGAVQRKSSQS